MLLSGLSCIIHKRIGICRDTRDTSYNITVKLCYNMNPKSIIISYNVIWFQFVIAKVRDKQSQSVQCIMQEALYARI